ncbi:MAG: hypothetical protein HGB29_01670 [Chlorobiaceae bacterium]|nr:hypothetical protein [Chlorobiaceae bacterium]NTW73551.1 hypothetical protein [Chlorobiaceae bacterium]
MKKAMFFVALASALGFSAAEAVELNWKGDIRYRYESGTKDDNVDTTEDHSRDRHRMRVRLGVYPWINEELSGGVQISTAGDETTSRNETYDDLFLADTVYFNEAFIDYHPTFLCGNVNILLGKRDVAKTLIVQKDLVWDSDLTFEGATLQYGKDGDGKEKDGLSAAVGYYAVDERNAIVKEQDPYLIAAVASYKGEVSDYSYAVGTGYYNFVHLENMDSQTTSTKPTLAQMATGKDFDVVEFFGNVGGNITETLPWKVYGQYAFNTANHDTDEKVNIMNSERDAYLVGLQVGNAKSPGQWSLSGEYVSIERDSVAPITDSDRNGASFTNLEGFKVSAAYHIVQNMTIGASYFNFDWKNKDIITTVADRDDRQHLIQADVVVKF